MKRFVLAVMSILWVVCFLVGCGQKNKDLIKTLGTTESINKVEKAAQEEEKKEGERAIQEKNKEAYEETLSTGEGQELQKVEREEQVLAGKLEAYLEAMTIEEKIGQMFMIAVRKDDNDQGVTQWNEALQKTFERYPVGGFVLFSENIQTKEQVQKLTRDLQAASKIPLFIGVDEEGGRVSRIGSQPNISEKPFLSADQLGKLKDERAVYEEAQRMGKLLHELGINMDFAPVADIFNEPSNTVIGKRSFGNSQEEVTPNVVAFAKGLKSQGIQPVVKHYPGHGNTKEDSHEGIAYIDKTLSELEKEELVPFEKAIEEKIGALMKGHLLVSEVDEDYMVSLSAKWNKYMRERYDLSDTLIMTDALEMGAVVNKYGVGEAAVLAVRAGNDILLMPYDLQKAFEGVYKAYTDGRISEDRINESVRKILSKKVAQNGLVLS